MKRILTLLSIVAFAFTSNAQDLSKYGETEEQQVLCQEALSLYKGYKKQKDYATAYPMWQEACEICPEKVSQTLYSDGATFIKAALKASDDKERKLVLRDSLMMIYDKRMELYPETKKNPLNKYTVLGYKAIDHSKLYKDQLAETNKMFQESVEMVKEKSIAAVLSGYYLNSFNLLKSMDPGTERDDFYTKILTDYLSISDYVDAGMKAAKAKVEAAADDAKKLKKAEKELSGYEKAKNNIDEIFVTIANCEEMIPVLQSKWKAAEGDLELAKKILNLMNKKGCSDNDLYLPIIEFVAENATEPDANIFYSLSIAQLKDKNYNGALENLEKAIENCPDCADREKYIIKAAQVAANLKRTGKAQKYANMALQLNSKNGEAYIVLGDCAAALSKSCDDGAIGARSVYWVAYDYYVQAKNVDSSVASKASSKMKGARGQWPSVEDLFTYGMTEGSSFTPSCLGKSTTVRSK